MVCSPDGSCAIAIVGAGLPVICHVCCSTQAAPPFTPPQRNSICSLNGAENHFLIFIWWLILFPCPRSFLKLMFISINQSYANEKELRTVTKMEEAEPMGMTLPLSSPAGRWQPGDA